MSFLRQLGLHQLCRPARVQKASFSAVSDFLQKAKSELESNPELKKVVEKLTKNAEAATDGSGSAVGTSKHRQRSTAQEFREQARGAGSVDPKADPSSSSGDSSSSDHEDQPRQSSNPQNASSGTSRSGSTNSRREESSGSSQKGDSQSSSSSRPPRPPLSQRLRKAIDAVRKEVTEAVLPRQEAVSATKARDPGVRPAGNPSSSAVFVVKQEETRWQKQWEEMQNKLGLHPLFQRLRGLSDNKVFNKGREVAGDLRERWETSDSPLVQRFQDMKDSMFVETEQAQALREIRSRYPSFDMVQFVRILKGDVPTVIKAYLKGDLKALEEHCAPEMMERFSGIVAAQKAEGLTSDATILDVSDVELVDLKFVDRNPVVVVQFTCQQINCTRDSFGNVVEGGPQNVQRVYYYWALQQEDAGFVGEDGKFHPPRWQLREMMIRGMHNLL